MKISFMIGMCMGIDLSAVKEFIKDFIENKKSKELISHTQYLEQELVLLSNELIELKNNYASSVSQNDLLRKQLFDVQNDLSIHSVDLDNVRNKFSQALSQIKLLERQLFNTQKDLYQLTSRKLSVEWFNKLMHLNKNRSCVVERITNEKEYDNLKIKFINLKNNLLYWSTLSVFPNECFDVIVALKSNFLGRNKIVMCVQYFDDNDQCISDGYTGLIHSSFFGHYFSYLNPTSESYNKIYSFKVPDGASKMKIGFSGFFVKNNSIKISHKIFILKNN